MSAQRSSDDALIGLTQEQLKRIDPLLAATRSVGPQGLKMDVDLASTMQELYEDLANIYLNMSETLGEYVAQQQAMGAVLSAEKVPDQDARDRYSS